MTKKEKESIDRLISLKSVNSGDKLEAYTLYKKYIEKEAVYCLNCDASVRQLFIRLTTWWKNKTVAYTFIKEIKNRKV